MTIRLGENLFLEKLIFEIFQLWTVQIGDSSIFGQLNLGHFN